MNPHNSIPSYSPPMQWSDNPELFKLQHREWLDNPFTLALLTSLQKFNEDLVKGAKSSAFISQPDIAIRKLQHSRMVDSILAYARGNNAEQWKRSNICE